MANQHNLACPACKSPDEIFLEVEITVKAHLIEDGADYDEGYYDG